MKVRTQDAVVEIELNGDRRTTLVRATYLRSYQPLPPIEGGGRADRNPGDSYDAEIGTSLAVGRALVDLGRRMIRQAEGQVKHRDDMRAYNLRAQRRGVARRLAGLQAAGGSPKTGVWVATLGGHEIAHATSAVHLSRELTERGIQGALIHFVETGS